MSPTISRIQAEAYEPYTAGEITQEEFLDRAKVPLKQFMLDQTETSALSMYCYLAGVDTPSEEAAL